MRLVNCWVAVMVDLEKELDEVKREPGEVTKGLGRDFVWRVRGRSTSRSSRGSRRGIECEPLVSEVETGRVGGGRKDSGIRVSGLRKGMCYLTK